MTRSSSFRARERRTTIELFEALGSSLDLRTVWTRAYPALLRLVPADYGALGVSSSGQPRDFQWIVANLPPAFFAAYPEMATHDFVRDAVTRLPNIVLRDGEMVRRPALERNMMYRRAREVGAPLEHVMAVMLHVDDRWQSGLSLYRERRRPFSDHERRTLQSLTAAMANMVRNCHVFGGAKDWASALEVLLADRGRSVLLMAPPGAEVARTGNAARLIDKWFAPHERPAGQLPTPIADALVRLTTQSQSAVASWRRRAADETLELRFLPLGGAGAGTRWALTLEEITDLPGPWRAVLTPSQRAIAAAILRGWTNQLIAQDRGIVEDTVKKHVYTIFNILGVDSRAALIARAVQLARR